MSHFARVENNIVTEVVVIEQAVLATGIAGDPTSFIQCSYNTRDGVHYDSAGNPDGGVAIRKNFPGVGWVYDPIADEFNPPENG